LFFVGGVTLLTYLLLFHFQFNLFKLGMKHGKLNCERHLLITRIKAANPYLFTSLFEPVRMVGCLFGILFLSQLTLTSFIIMTDVINKLASARETILEQLSQVIVGQTDVIDELLISVFSRGHCLLEGVPGLAKTLMISTLARTLDLSFSRIQFTPDLMPADITGIDIIEENKTSGSRDYRFLQGPLFANMVLADEINRTPPKTQSALLEAMQERRVTVGRIQHALPDPFFVLATQNPIEQEGTYPLPEAQQDRFMFKVFVRYPDFNDEFEIVRRTTAVENDELKPVLSGAEIIELQKIVRQVPVSDHAIRYALAIVRQTRVSEKVGVPEIVEEYVAWGAGPRAVQFLVLGAKARALLAGRSHVICEDIQALAKPVLRHRLVMSFLAESEGMTADKLIEQLVTETPIKEDDLLRDARFQSLFAG
jgi:MoxR-like ATPase